MVAVGLLLLLPLIFCRAQRQLSPSRCSPMLLRHKACAVQACLGRAIQGSSKFLILNKMQKFQQPGVEPGAYSKQISKRNLDVVGDHGHTHTKSLVWAKASSCFIYIRLRNCCIFVLHPPLSFSFVGACGVLVPGPLRLRFAAFIAVPLMVPRCTRVAPRRALTSCCHLQRVCTPPLCARGSTLRLLLHGQDSRMLLEGALLHATTPPCNHPATTPPHACLAAGGGHVEECVFVWAVDGLASAAVAGVARGSVHSGAAGSAWLRPRIVCSALAFREGHVLPA